MGITYNASVVRSGLVLHLDAANLKSYPGSGTTWTDLTGNGNNGTLVNGVGYSAGNKGSMVFDGVDDYVTSPANTFLTNSQKEGQLTYEYWLKPTGDVKTGCTESNSGVSFYSPGAACPQGLAGDISYNYGTTDSIYVGMGFAFGTNGFILGVHKNSYAPFILVDYKSYSGISQLVVIKNTTACSYYVNGNFIKTSLTIAGGSTIIGDAMGYITSSSNSFTKNFKGEIYSVRFYSKALTAAEIKQNFEALRDRYRI